MRKNVFGRLNISKCDYSECSLSRDKKERVIVSVRHSVYEKIYTHLYYYPIKNNALPAMIIIAIIISFFIIFLFLL